MKFQTLREMFEMMLVELRRPAGFIDGLRKDTMIQIILMARRIRIKGHYAVRPEPPDGVNDPFMQGIAENINLPPKTLDTSKREHAQIWYIWMINCRSSKRGSVARQRRENHISC
jgi:hypothetical protein